MRNTKKEKKRKQPQGRLEKSFHLVSIASNAPNVFLSALFCLSVFLRHHFLDGELAPLGVGSGSGSPLLPPLVGVSVAGLGVMSLSSSSSSRSGVDSLFFSSAGSP